MQGNRQSIGNMMLVALLAALLGSTFTYAWIRYGAPAPSQAQTPAAVAMLNQSVVGSTAIERAAEVIGPSVVNIDTETVEPRNPHSRDFLRHFFGDTPHSEHPDIQNGVGSGVIVSAEGYILTNEHVIHGASGIKVTLTNHTHYTGRVVGADKLSDIAILKIDANHLPVALLGDSTEVKVGQWVVAVGNPFQFEHTVTVGVISGRGRSLPDSIKEYRDLLQTDAAINPGNSGGPLCDLAGQVIGINTAIIPYAQGIGFAIPINAAHHVMDQLIKSGHVVRPYIGVIMAEVSDGVVLELHLPSRQGVLVTGVAADSPAERIGLRRGDVIVRIGGQKFGSPSELQSLVRAKTVGDHTQLDYIRSGQLLSTEVTVAEMPDIDNLRPRR